MVTLRVGFSGFVAGGRAACGCGDAVPDGDLLRPDEDLFDQQPLHSLEVECPALEIPETIRVNIADLKPQEPIHVRDLKLPEGIKAMNAPDLVVVQLAAVAV